MERPYQCPAPGPREVRAPQQPGEGGGGRRRRGSASAHTHNGHAGNTRRATGLSLRNAQSAWNGVPAIEGKGHPDGTARHTQCGARGAGRGNGGDTTPGTGPSPPNVPRAPRTHGKGTAPAKAVVAHCATPQSQGYAATAPAEGCPTGDKAVARTRQHRRPARPCIRGATQWVSARSHGSELMH